MIFNDVEKDYIRVRKELFRPPSPPIAFDSIEQRKGGSRVKSKRFTNIELPVPIRISSKKRIEELKEEMSDWLIKDEAKKLVFKDTPNRYYLAYYEGMELDEKTPYYATGYIYFYLPDGHRYGEQKTIQVTTTPTTHTITGQDETPWIVEVVFTSATDKFELQTNKGLYLLLGYNFIEGDRLTIKYEGREVWLNGEDLRHAVRMKSNYEMLEPGEIEISVSHECNLIYDERYY
ncbi:distal tail protein Dit [Microbulbifer pacificus]|uniref:distal tail protein Dit n=1 Tax=Microbulbifer pacificus TaxID=407164 RepID=UPI000CF4CC18|nr:distal tail protein Dit [Microbulbifer pacificus]